jgi:hypothetical protein
LIKVFYNMSRRYWYSFKGTGDDDVPGNYTFAGNNPGSCSGGSSACQIYATGSGVPLSNPSEDAITLRIQSYLATAKNFSYPFYPLSPSTPYVATRNQL